MAEIVTSRPINVSQLAHEVRAPLHVVGPYADGRFVIRAEAVDLPTLEAKVSTHSANPAWVNPDAPPAQPTKREVAAQKVAAVPAGPIKDALVALMEAI